MRGLDFMGPTANNLAFLVVSPSSLPGYTPVEKFLDLGTAALPPGAVDSGNGALTPTVPALRGSRLSESRFSGTRGSADIMILKHEENSEGAPRISLVNCRCDAPW